MISTFCWDVGSGKLPFHLCVKQNRMCSLKTVMTILDTILTTWLQDGI